MLLCCFVINYKFITEKARGWCSKTTMRLGFVRQPHNNFVRIGYWTIWKLFEELFGKELTMREWMDVFSFSMCAMRRVSSFSRSESARICTLVMAFLRSSTTARVRESSRESAFDASPSTPFTRITASPATRSCRWCRSTMRASSACSLSPRRESASTCCCDTCRCSSTRLFRSEASLAIDASHRAMRFLYERVYSNIDLNIMQ